MTSLNHEDSAVQAHLTILQNVINRMAGNSAACKTWCVTMVSAIFVVAADKGNPALVPIALGPIIILGGLDAYYLGLERAFRATYNKFIKKLHTGTASPEDLFSVIPNGKLLAHFASSLASWAVWPVYTMMAAGTGLLFWIL